MTQFTEAQQDKLNSYINSDYNFSEYRGTEDPKIESDVSVSTDGTKTSMPEGMKKLGTAIIAKLVKFGYLQVETSGKWVIYTETLRFAELTVEKDKRDAYEAARWEVIEIGREMISGKNRKSLSELQQEMETAQQRKDGLAELLLN
jgi:hypothetical protein